MVYLLWSIYRSWRIINCNCVNTWGEKLLGASDSRGFFWKTIEQIGGASFTFMVPILAGYIAYSIADKPGLVPGMIGGYIAATGRFYGSESGAGFLGGIIAGFLAGYIALGIKN